jgi:hypothetical protein
MYIDDMLQKLHEAQALLSEVYYYTQEIKNGSAETAMGCADTCIWEAIDALEKFGGK